MQGDKELSLHFLMICSSDILYAYWKKSVIPLNRMCKILLKLYHLLKEAILKWREGCYSLEGSREGQSPAASSSLLSAAQLCTNFFFTWLFHKCICCHCSKLSKEQGTAGQNCFYSESKDTTACGSLSWINYGLQGRRSLSCEDQ